MMDIDDDTNDVYVLIGDATLLCDPQESIYPRSDAIVIFGQYDKVKAPVFRYITALATSYQSVYASVTDEYVTSATDHYYHSDDIIPSLTLCMNKSSNA